MWFLVEETIHHPCGGVIVEKGSVLYREQIDALCREGVDNIKCTILLTEYALRQLTK
jgi:hypothetical protein